MVDYIITYNILVVRYDNSNNKENKGEKMKNLVAVYYNYEGEFNSEPRELECITDDFDKWLEEHNKDRIADDEMEENAYEFDVEPISIIIYNKEKK